MAEPQIPKWTRLQEGQRGPNVAIPDWVPTTAEPVSAVPAAPVQQKDEDGR